MRPKFPKGEPKDAEALRVWQSARALGYAYAELSKSKDASAATLALSAKDLRDAAINIAQHINTNAHKK